ncbi:MAG: DUF89 family protein [Thermoplasmata archaeon]|nr:MAG: DUF89 family protein [Thermoplasmata archaeon]
MKMKPRCVPCLLNRVLYEAELANASQERQEEVIKKTAEQLLEEYKKEKSSAQIATIVHKMAYDLLGEEDPYRELKKRSNEVAKKIIPKAEDFIRKSKDKLEASILCSIVGNSIDFGIAGSASSPEELYKKFDEVIKEGIQHNDLDKVKKYLRGNVLYFTDNCGEIVFDKLVCRELKKYNVNLTLVVKGVPILTDATYEDAISLSFNEVVDEILTTGTFAVGVDFDAIPHELRKKLQNADLIICKGMANYEAFSETSYKPIAYFLKVKCKSIAEDMHLPLGINAIKLYE